MIEDILLKLMFNIWKIAWTSEWFTFFTWKNGNWKNLKTYSKLHNKREYVVYMRNLRQGLNYGLVLKKVHRVIKFNHKCKNGFKKGFFKLMSNAVFGKTIEIWENIET